MAFDVDGMCFGHSFFRDTFAYASTVFGICIAQFMVLSFFFNSKRENYGVKYIDVLKRTDRAV